MADNRKFIADVGRFRDFTRDKMIEVVSKSLNDVISFAQNPVGKGGNMPVVTSNLRNSFVTQLDGNVKVESTNDAPVDPTVAIILTMKQFQLGQVIGFAWTAPYAIKRHYLVGGPAGGGLWRDKAAQQWKRIVDKNARAVQ